MLLMLKEELTRFLKSIGKTTIEFNKYQYKGLDANEFHWDKYVSGDLFDFYENPDEEPIYYSFTNLDKLDKKPKYPEKYLEYLYAVCDVDNLLILFFGLNNEDIDLDRIATEHVINPPASRLLAIFKLDDLSKEGFIIKINFKEND